MDEFFGIVTQNRYLVAISLLVSLATAVYYSWSALKACYQYVSRIFLSAKEKGEKARTDRVRSIVASSFDTSHFIAEIVLLTYRILIIIFFIYILTGIGNAVSPISKSSQAGLIVLESARLIRMMFFGLLGWYAGGLTSYVRHVRKLRRQSLAEERPGMKEWDW